MPIRRVFIIWTHPLFHEAVCLLLKHPEIKLLGADSDYETAHEQILELQPDTIIVEEGGESIPSEVMSYLDTYPWNLRVTFLNLTDNQLNMYQHEQRTMGRADDLLQLILSETTSGG
jgi:DNA-binding NarL/FixJ family response regulator